MPEYRVTFQVTVYANSAQEAADICRRDIDRGFGYIRIEGEVCPGRWKLIDDNGVRPIKYSR